MSATSPTLLRLSAGDNVLIAARALTPGDHATRAGDRVVVTEAIALGHKVAAEEIPAGTRVVRSGMPIGHATAAIPAGRWVHTHNLVSDYIATFDTRGGGDPA